MSFILELGVEQLGLWIGAGLAGPLVGEVVARILGCQLILFPLLPAQRSFFLFL